MIPLAAAAAFPLPLNAIAAAISALYGVVTSLNDFLDDHIAAMKGNANATVRATGNLLEGAKFGFGLGYLTSVVIIAIGQIILGNPLTALWSVGTAAVALNPVAMTCGAIGAIFYGWKALSEDERNEIINRITAAFEVGAELIKAIINFLLTSLGNLLSSETMVEYKRMVATAAREFGKSLSDITHSVRDRLVDTAVAVSHAVGKSTEAILDGVSSATDSVKKNVTLAASSLMESAESATQHIRGTSKKE